MSRLCRKLASTLVVFLFASVSHAQQENITVVLVGDSTVTDSAGWGKAFAGRFGENVKTLNFAAGGRSAKSFYEEQRLWAALEAKPDYVLIQFGHNGQPGKGPARETDPATTYRDFLRIYVNKSREIGATPILLSSVVRRNFGEDDKINSSLTPWAEAAKAVATEMKTPFLDLHTASMEFHNQIGPAASKTFSPKEGDSTHFNQKGAEAIADLIVKELMQAEETLASYLK